MYMCVCVCVSLCINLCLKWVKWRYHSFHACLSCMPKFCPLTFLTKASSILLFKLWENATIPFLTDTVEWGGLAINSFPYIHGSVQRTCNIKLPNTVLDKHWWHACRKKKNWYLKRKKNSYTMAETVLQRTCPWSYTHTENHSFVSFDTSVMFHCLLLSQTRWSGTEHAV